MSFYGVVFRLLGWAVGLGLATGELTYYKDGHSDGLMVAAGIAILVWWAYVTFGAVVRKASAGTPSALSTRPVAVRPSPGMTPRSAAAEVPARESAGPAELPPDAMQLTLSGMEIPEDDAASAPGADTPVPSGVFPVLVALGVAYYKGVQNDTDDQRRMYNLGIAQAYDATAENFDQLRGDGGRLALARRLREVAELAHDGGIAETTQDRKNQSFGQAGGYAAIAAALESSDPVATLERVLAGVRGTTG